MDVENKCLSLYTESLICLVEEFREKIISGTKTSENFMTISEIEYLWNEMRGKTNVIYSEMLEEIIKGIDETELINKKNRISEKGNKPKNQ